MCGYAPGASKGIGYAIAKLFIANGYSVVNLSRGECSLSGVHNISCDLSDVEGVSRVGKQVAAWLADQNPDSKPVHLVNNAGTYTVDSTRGSIDWRAFQRVMDVNVTAPAVLTAELADALLGAKQASVVYIGSTLSEQSIANGASYCTSKHALVGLMRATTQDFFHTNTHSVCVCPGFVGTDMMQANVDGMDVDAKDAFLSQ
jgi:3-oxoacyl-[acyl-carrier protein] reductase